MDLSCLLVLDDYIQSAVFVLFYAFRQGGLVDSDFSLLEIVENLIDHVVVERSQVVSSGHHADLIAHSSQKTSNLDTDIPSSNH